jgi:hypothetical protein
MRLIGTSCISNSVELSSFGDDQKYAISSALKIVFGVSVVLR